jgi:hypothetical protein
MEVCPKCGYYVLIESFSEYVGRKYCVKEKKNEELGRYICFSMPGLNLLIWFFMYMDYLENRGTWVDGKLKLRKISLNTM